MRPLKRLFTALALCVGALVNTATAQNQVGTWNTQYSYNNYTVTTLTIFGNPSPECGARNFRRAAPTEPWGSSYGGPETYYSLPAGSNTFTARWDHNQPNIAFEVPLPPLVQVFVDGEYCPSCTVEFTEYAPAIAGGQAGYAKVNVALNPGWSYEAPGVHQIGLRLSIRVCSTCPPYPVGDIRFNTMVVGTAYTDLLGYYTAPALPIYILRDPPGDGSYATITAANDVCTGNTSSITTGDSQDGYFKARLGLAGTVPFVGLSYEFFVEAGVSVSASQTETSNNEYQTCLSTSTTYSTAASGTPDDVFIGSAARYAYGMGRTFTRPTCATTAATIPEFVSAQIGDAVGYTYSESEIRGDVIPDLIATIGTMTVGTAEHTRAVAQLDVWYQTLAMNDSIKANAEFETTQLINGGGIGIDHTRTYTTTESYAIQYDAVLEEGLSLDFGVNIGGSGVSGGLTAKFQQGYGEGENGSNVATNTVQYHLEDANGSDDLAVKVKRDAVFGTYVFELDSAQSQTSCPYEGGYQVDQPRLSVGTPGNTYMVINEAPIGNTLTFPLYICNDSQFEMTYNIKVRGGTNTEGGTVVVLGENISSDILGQECEAVPANGCYAVTNLFLTDPNTSDEINDFNIELYLYSPCEPSIRSTIIIEAHFGPGNFGSYCIPTSESAATAGDWIDGVQVGNIDNTGTGGLDSPTYTDYSAQFSTPLSRNAQRVLTITAGTRTGVHYSAWIDYNRNNVFEDNERLGSFINNTSNEVRNINFTVPANAPLGSTLMRVRGVRESGGVIAVVDPCFSHEFGETEDYAVVINANTPQDCAGVNNGAALPGTPCNDNNTSTGNDTWTANCQCVGLPLDCAGIPGGGNVPGIPCDDNNPATGGDVYNVNCQCLGLAYDCLGVIGGSATIGSACDDNNADTGNDVYTANCTCAGQVIDCLGVVGGNTVPGTPCDDGNPLSGGDAYNASCQCVGTIATDCAGVPGGSAQPGTPCDDNNNATDNDVYSANCVCAGLPLDCAGTPGGVQLPGTPCNDGNPLTTGDVFTANCACVGVAANDCAGVPGGSAQPGTPCNDNDPDTGNDTWNSFCTCVGQAIDCEGTIGGFALPGFPCDDEDANTGSDTYGADCNCAGLPLDCEGVAGGTSNVGSPCDDANANTSNDVYTANCICAGTLATDCEGTAGGSAQPGTPCDDNDANTGNDVYTANCDCAGQVIDCLGVIGGAALPGTPCDDGLACTVNDVRGANCGCSGTTLTIGSVAGATAILGNSSNAYVITPVANATSYTWELPNGWTSADNNAFVLVAEADNTPGAVELCVTVMVGGCELTSCATVTVDFNTGITTNEASAGEWLNVQPNPSNGIFQLRASTTDAAPLSISIRNGLGQEVLAPFNVAGQRAIDMDLSDVASGAYYLLATRNGEQQVIKIMVQR